MTKKILKKGKLLKIDFQICNTLIKDIFNDKYDKHYIGNELYVI